MDLFTILLMVVIGVIAASQLIQHSGAWILRPYVFWPVELLLLAAGAFVLLARFSDNAQLDWSIKIFLTLFLAWRLLQNWMHREKVRRNESVAAFNAAERQRKRDALDAEEALDGEEARNGEGGPDDGPL